MQPGENAGTRCMASAIFFHHQFQFIAIRLLGRCVFSARPGIKYVSEVL